MATCGPDLKPRKTVKSPTGVAWRVLIAAISVLALCVVLPTAAGAAGTSLQWKGQAFMPLTKSTAATWEGSITVADPEYPISEKFNYSVQCNDKLEGSIGTNGGGEITKVTMSNCIGVGSCSKETANIATFRLPWHTELSKTETGAPIERIVSGGKGAPEFGIKCKGLVEEYCQGDIGLNVTKMESVTGTFDKSDLLQCGLNSKPSAYAEGSQSLSGAAGIEEGTPVWAGISSEQPVNWSKGRLTLIDNPAGPNGAPWGVTCEEAGEGAVNTSGTGSIGKITLSNCERSGNSECNGGGSLEALHLSWKTQLYLGSLEQFSDAIGEGASGAVAFKIVCTINGFKEEDTCEATSSASGRLATFMTNGVEKGVKASYYTPRQGAGLHCHRGALEEGGELWESSHVIKRSNGAELTVSE